MGKNVMAAILRVIGGVAAACCIVAGFILGDEADGIIGLAIALSGLVNCALFYGFAEIISLLQKNADTQELILKQMNKGENIEGPSSIGLLQNIEENLPPI